MKSKSFKMPNNAVQQAIMKAAMASARIEGILIAEKEAQKSLQAVVSKLTKDQKKG